MNFTFLRSDVLRAVHVQLIRTYGGLPGVRDEHARESAVTRPRQLQDHTGEARVGALAASCSWAILRNHPFADGNTSVTLAALAMAAELNGCRLTCSESEETAMVLQGASHQISEEEWTAWVLRVVVAK